MTAAIDWSQLVVAVAGVGVFALALYVLSRSGGGS
jgi:hypothetical protein